MWGVRPSLTLVSNVWVAVASSIQVKAEQSESKCSSRGMMEQTEEREIEYISMVRPKSLDLQGDLQGYLKEMFEMNRRFQTPMTFRLPQGYEDQTDHSV